MDCADIALIVLAAGLGSRFGADKLSVPLNGLPVGLHIAHTSNSIDFGWRFAICSPASPLTPRYVDYGFTVIDNANPEAGQAHSLHLAIRAAEDTDAKALLVTLADMPFVTEGLLRKIAAFPTMAASYNGRNAMPPVLFPRTHWAALLNMQGDAGGRSLLHAAQKVEASVAELRDIDVPDDLVRPADA
jgi:molybdenum cofactor cytidylyltransferase